MSAPTFRGITSSSARSSAEASWFAGYLPPRRKNAWGNISHPECSSCSPGAIPHKLCIISRLRHPPQAVNAECYLDTSDDGDSILELSPAALLSPVVGTSPLLFSTLSLILLLPHIEKIILISLLAPYECPTSFLALSSRRFTLSLPSCFFQSTCHNVFLLSLQSPRLRSFTHQPSAIAKPIHYQAKDQGQEPVDRARWRRDDSNHMAGHQGQIHSSLP